MLLFWMKCVCKINCDVFLFDYSTAFRRESSRVLIDARRVLFFFVELNFLSYCVYLLIFYGIDCFFIFCNDCF